ncbi:MAG: hydrogenase maturation nickel metallochaperone HypA [Candidatus Neomarinimicrobiota bacterium]
MHEMSLALEILRIVEKTARMNHAPIVKDIFIEVGTLAGVMVHALEFCLEVAKKDTPAGGAVIHIEQVPGKGKCPVCDQEYPMATLIEPCPVCDTSYLAMTAGDDLRLREIEVESQI